MSETFGDEEGLLRFWVFGGSAGRAAQFKEEYDIEGPVLVDDDGSLRQAYVGTTVDPEAEHEVLVGLLR